MTANPNPNEITDEMWNLWDNRPNKDWKLSGIFANKPGYHNTVNNNLRNWKGHYSILLPLDLVSENRNKARAIDLTMSDAEMVKWTKRMRDSALNPADDRLAAVREFYGTVDNKNVFGLIKDDLDGPWRESTSDNSHLWHGHTSIFTYFVNNWSMLKPILSVWAGESLGEWRLNKMMLPKKGDSGEGVRYWQYIHNEVRTTVNPAAPQISVDGEYGDTTAKAFADFWKKSGGTGTFAGNYVTAWLATRYHKAFAFVSAPRNNIPLPTGPTDKQIQDAVNLWLSQHFNTIQGTFTGKVTF